MVHTGLHAHGACVGHQAQRGLQAHYTRAASGDPHRAALVRAEGHVHQTCGHLCERAFRLLLILWNMAQSA